MLFLTQFKLASIDKKIISALKNSEWFEKYKDGDIYKMSLSDIDRSEKWVSYVNSFVDKIFSENIYTDLLTNANLTKDDVVEIFLLMTIATLPNPFFKTGKSRLGYTLVASSMYQEIDKQLKEFIGSLSFQQENNWEQKQFGHRFATHCLTFARHLKEFMKIFTVKFSFKMLDKVQYLKP